MPEGALRPLSPRHRPGPEPGAEPGRRGRVVLAAGAAEQPDFAPLPVGAPESLRSGECCPAAQLAGVNASGGPSPGQVAMPGGIGPGHGGERCASSAAHRDWGRDRPTARTNGIGPELQVGERLPGGASYLGKDPQAPARFGDLGEQL